MREKGLEGDELAVVGSVLRRLGGGLQGLEGLDRSLKRLRRSSLWELVLAVMTFLQGLMKVSMSERSNLGKEEDEF